jgi:hypothetical protein
MPRKIGRDAGTGQFIPVAKAKKNPGTTVVETLPIPKKKGK